jgi:hypothetical protein
MIYRLDSYAENEKNIIGKMGYLSLGPSWKKAKSKFVEVFLVTGLLSSHSLFKF